MKSWQIGLLIIALSILIYMETHKKDLIKAASKIVTNLTRSQFFEKFGPIVKKVSKGTGLFPSLFLAQALLESSDSKGIPANSSLTKEANNFFGIKADKKWTGPYVLKKTREVFDGKEVMVYAKFRKYSTPYDSFKDRVDFLKKNSRYTKAGVFSATTPEQQAQALQNAGYATDPNYAKTLSNIIHNYSLKTFDL